MMVPSKKMGHRPAAWIALRYLLCLTWHGSGTKVPRMHPWLNSQYRAGHPILPQSRASKKQRLSSPHCTSKRCVAVTGS